MEMTTIEFKNLDHVVATVLEVDLAIRDLGDLELALVGGGVGDVEF